MSNRRMRYQIAASDILCGLYLLREDELKRHNLSKREAVVAQHLLNGEGTMSIAKKLRLSIPGVKYHIRNILAKTKRPNREEFCKLIRIGVEGSERIWRDKYEIRHDAAGRFVVPKRV